MGVGIGPGERKFSVLALSADQGVKMQFRRKVSEIPLAQSMGIRIERAMAPPIAAFFPPWSRITTGTATDRAAIEALALVAISNINEAIKTDTQRPRHFPRQSRLKAITNANAA